MKHHWVYIATPSGADLWRTVALAKGNVFQSGVGVLRRRLPEDDSYRQRVRELRPEQVLLLTYDLFHSGLVYPLGEFRLDEPQCEGRPRVEQVDGFPALGRVADDPDLWQLEPDYVSDEGLEHVLLGEFQPLAAEDARMIYERIDTNDDRALHRSSPCSPLKEIKPRRARALLDALVPESEAAVRALGEMAQQIPHVVRLDGRGKQLLIESRLADEAIGPRPRSYALAAFPLCLLAEYEIQRLLARMARHRLRSGQDLRIEGSADELSWVPDPTVYEEGFRKCISLFSRLECRELGLEEDERRALRRALHKTASFRNRLAHSYFLEERHYRDLRRLVAEQLEIMYAHR